MSENWLTRLVPEYVQNFAPYAPSPPDEELMRRFGVTRLHRLNNNENALGPPPAAREVIRNFDPDRAAIYPNGDSRLLRRALAEKFGKEPEQFLVGNGSCEVIGSVIRAFCAPGDAIVTADKTFAVYEWVAAFSGVTARLVPLDGFSLDPRAMLEAAAKGAKAVFVCNPNNPTGSFWDEAALVDFLEAIGQRCLVVLDEAYCEYVDKPEYPDGLRLLERFPNLAVFRTFSKMYGLAGFRVGYVCASPQVIEMASRAHVAYSVNALGQATAVACLEDDGGHVAASRRMTAASRAIVLRAARALNLPVVSGEGNYLMLQVPLSDTLLYRRLMRREFMVRTMTGFRFPDWIRVSLARPELMERFCLALADALERKDRP